MVLPAAFLCTFVAVNAMYVKQLSGPQSTRLFATPYCILAIWYSLQSHGSVQCGHKGSEPLCSWNLPDFRKSMTKGATCGDVAIVVCGRCNMTHSAWKSDPSLVSSSATVPSFGPVHKHGTTVRQTMPITAAFGPHADGRHRCNRPCTYLAHSPKTCFGYCQYRCKQACMALCSVLLRSAEAWIALAFALLHTRLTCYHPK